MSELEPVRYHQYSVYHSQAIIDGTMIDHDASRYTRFMDEIMLPIIATVLSQDTFLMIVLCLDIPRTDNILSISTHIAISCNEKNGLSMAIPGGI